MEPTVGREGPWKEWLSGGKGDEKQVREATERGELLAQGSQ